MDLSKYILNNDEKYQLPEEPDCITDAVILAAYPNPPTPEEEARLQVGLRYTYGIVDVSFKVFPSGDKRQVLS